MDKMSPAEKNRVAAREAQKKAELKRARELRKQERERKQLYQKIRRSDAPRYYQECLKQIAKATAEGHLETTAFLSLYGGEREGAYPWSILRAEVERLLQRDGYRTKDASFYQEQNNDMCGDVTHVQIEVSWAK